MADLWVAYLRSQARSGNNYTNWHCRLGTGEKVSRDEVVLLSSDGGDSTLADVDAHELAAMTTARRAVAREGYTWHSVDLHEHHDASKRRGIARRRGIPRNANETGKRQNGLTQTEMNGFSQYRHSTSHNVYTGHDY